MKLPTDAPRNQTPIIEPTMRAGASLVIDAEADRAQASSAKVCTRYTMNSHHGLTSAPPAAIARRRDDDQEAEAHADQPERELHGADGCFEPSFSHSHANIGAKMMMNSAFSDWNQLLGNPNPEGRCCGCSDRRRGSASSRPARTPTRRAPHAMKNTTITHRRPRSCGVQPDRETARRRRRP